MSDESTRAEIDRGVALFREKVDLHNEHALREAKRFAGMSMQERMPPGTRFEYLGRPCVAKHYADQAEHAHTGRFGLVFEYVDVHGVIHERCILPEVIDAFLARSVKNPEPPEDIGGMVGRGI